MFNNKKKVKSNYENNYCYLNAIKENNLFHYSFLCVFVVIEIMIYDCQQHLDFFFILYITIFISLESQIN